MTTPLPPGQTVTVNDMQMYYMLHGEGEPLLLLHGFTGSSSDWSLFFHDLASEYRLVIPDLRGHGRSTNPSREFTFRQAALDVFALLDHLGIERFKAIGFSGGGNTLLHMATRAPQRVMAMVLASATSYFPEQARVLMRDRSGDSITDEEWRRLRQTHHYGDEQIQSLIEQSRSWSDRFDDMNFTPPYLASISARALIIYGDRDFLYPLNIAVEMYAAIPHSYLWIVPNGDHLPVFNNPLVPFTVAVLPFLRGDWERE